MPHKGKVVDIRKDAMDIRKSIASLDIRKDAMDSMDNHWISLTEITDSLAREAVSLVSSGFAALENSADKTKFEHIIGDHP